MKFFFSYPHQLTDFHISFTPKYFKNNFHPAKRCTGSHFHGFEPVEKLNSRKL
jgi:hypothetical protein